MSWPSINYYIGTKPSRVLQKWLDDNIHRVPRRLIECCSSEQIGALYEGLLEGDGTSNWEEKWTVFTPGKKYGLEDDFQEIATKLCVNTVKYFISSNGQWCVDVNQRRHHWLRRPRRVRYSGLVWNISTPSETFVARQNGRVFVTGSALKQA